MKVTIVTLAVFAGWLTFMVSGSWLSTSSDVAWLSFAWLLLQIPAGGLVSSALALGITAVRTRGRRVASGLTGSAPILAMMLGSPFLTLSGATPTLSLGIGPWIAAIFTIPLAVSTLILAGNTANVRHLWWLAVGTALVAGALRIVRLTWR